MRKAAVLAGTRAARDSWQVARSTPAPLALPALLALAAWLAFFNQLGGFPLFDVDEGAFSEATREMLERGDFVTTWLNGQPRFDKPILTYWLQALSVSLFGMHEFAFRLPSALAGLGWIGAILPYSGLFLRILPAIRTLRASPLDTFLWCWFLFVLLFFSMAGTKLPHYLLYGVSPLFVLMAIRRFLLASRWLAFLPSFLLLAAVMALPAALQWFGPGIRDAYVREAMMRTEPFGRGYALASAGLLLAMLALAFLPRYEVWQRLIAIGVLCSLAVGGLLLPALGQLQQGPVKEAALYARQHRLAVRTWQFNVPSFSVYRGQVTERAAAPRPGEVLLTRSSALAALGPVEVLYRKGGVVLVKIGR